MIPSPTPIRIAVFDDRPLIVMGLTRVFQYHDEMVLVGAAANAADFQTILDRIACDVAILGVWHPAQAGLQLLGDILARWPKLLVLILCAYPSQEVTAAALRLGASGGLTDFSSPAQILDAIRTVAAGRPYVDSSTTTALITALRGKDPASEKNLSRRQMQILRLYASGKTVTEIAGLTGLSVRTVSTYKARMLEKLQLSSNAHLIAYAIGNKLIGDTFHPVSGPKADRR